MADESRDFTRTEWAYVGLVAVPIGLGFLIQWLVAPQIPAYGFFEVMGFVIAAILGIGYFIRSLITRRG